MRTRERAIWPMGGGEEEEGRKKKHGSMAGCCESVVLLRDAEQGGDRLGDPLRGDGCQIRPLWTADTTENEEHAIGRCAGTRSRRVHH